MQDGGLLRQHHAYHGEDDDDDDALPPYGVVEWYGGPFITTANHNLSVNDDYDYYEATKGLIPDEDWRGTHEDDAGAAQWGAEVASNNKKKDDGQEGGWREVVAFYRSAEAWRKPNLMYIFFSFFLYMLAYAYSSAMIPLVVTELCDGDVSAASSIQGYLSAVNAGATLVTAALLGLISDRWGRIPCLLVSLVGFGVDMGVLAAAPVIGWGVWPLYWSRAVGGACYGFYTAGYAYIADISRAEDRSKNFGALGIATGLGFMAGPTVAGYLGEARTAQKATRPRGDDTDRFDLAIPLLVAVFFTTINILFVGFVMVESKGEEKKPWEWRRLNPLRSFYMLLESRLALGVALTYFLMFLAEEGLIAVFVLYLKYKFGWGPLDIGISMSLFGLTYCVSQGVLIRYLLPWLGDRKTLLLAMLIDALSSWPYALVPSGFYLYPIMVFRSVAFLAMPVSKGIISKQYGMAQQGELMGVLSGLKTITAFIGPLVYNTLFTYFTTGDPWPTKDPGLVYYIASANFCVAFLACCLVFWLFPETKANNGNGSKPSGGATVDNGWESDFGVEGERLRSDIGTLRGDSIDGSDEPPLARVNNRM